MKIIEIVVYGYKKFSLNSDNQSLRIKMDADIQVIIGSNGSGKSMLIRLLLLCIPPGTDFEKDGFFYLTIEHNNKTYYIGAIYKTPAGTFTFNELRDDVWVARNKSGNISTQRELIAQTFGLSSSVQQLLIGRENFTSMGAARRRQWFVNMSQTDYDYAIAVFQKYKEAHRDVCGAIKMSKIQLTQEKANQLKDEDVSEYLRKQKMLQNDIVMLLKHTPASRKSKAHLVEQINDLVADIERIVPANKIALPEPPSGINDYQQLCAMIASLTETLESSNARSQKLFQQWSDLKNNLQAVTDVGAENIGSLKSERQQLSQAITQGLASLKLNLKVTDTERACELYAGVKKDLVLAIFELPSNPDELYSARKLSAVELKITEKQKSLRNLQLVHSQINSEIKTNERIIHDHKTVCPSCEHNFIHGFDPKSHNELVNRLAMVQNQIESLEADISKDLDFKSELINYREKFLAVRSLVSKLGAINGLERCILESPTFAEFPRNAVNVLQDIEVELSTLKQIDDFEKRLSEVNANLLILGKLSDNDLEHYHNRLKEYADELENLTSTISACKNKLGQLKQFKCSIDAASELNSAAQSKLGLLDETYAAFLAECFNECVEAMRSSLTSELAFIDSLLLKNTMARAGVEMLEKEIAKNTESERLYKIILDELSPSTGLIAEGMIGFINEFIDTMNTLIKKFWNYPLEINRLMPTGDEVDLDYLFPFASGDELTHHDDVNEGSTGMMEIFNIVFKIACMRCLNILDMPLSLDEPGAGFDKRHRVNTVHAIKSIMEELPFTQLYLVSHYIDGYGSFSNSQTTIMCSRNIE